MTDSTRALERAKAAALELKNTAQEREQDTLRSLKSEDIAAITEAARQAKELPKGYESNTEALSVYRDELYAAQKDAAQLRLAGGHEARPNMEAFDSQIAKATASIQAVGLSLSHHKAALHKSAEHTEMGVGK